MSADFKTILYREEDSIAFISLNRPKKLNAFNQQMLKDLLAVFDNINKQDSIGAVIITGTGKAFCAGADLSSGKDTFNSEFDNSSEITIFEQKNKNNNKDNKLGELLADMEMWNFGLPFADVLPSGKILVFYYAGNNKQMNLYWFRLTL